MSKIERINELKLEVEALEDEMDMRNAFGGFNALAIARGIQAEIAEKLCEIDCLNEVCS